MGGAWPVSVGRYTLVSNGGTRLMLPSTAMVTSGNGTALAYRLGRQVEGDEWEEFGDGKPIPRALVLEWELKGVSETDASSQATAMWELAQDLAHVERDNRTYRPIRKPLEYDIQHITTTFHALVLTLAPRGPKWLALKDNAPRAF